MLASSVITNSMQGPPAAKVTDIHHLPQYIPEKDTILRNVQLGGPTGKHYEEQKHHGYRRVSRQRNQAVQRRALAPGHTGRLAFLPSQHVFSLT